MIFLVVTKVPEESIQNGEAIVDIPDICNSSQQVEEVSKLWYIYIANISSN